MQTGILWAADIASFTDLNKISFTQYHSGDLVAGLDVVKDYKNPPGTVVGIYTDLPTTQRTEAFEKNMDNIKIALTYWDENNMLVESSEDV